jgi:CBS domain containing-hemolysin-like protein
MSNDNNSDPPRRDGLINTLRRMIGRPRESGLRQELESVIETHEAENPEDRSNSETTSMLRNLITFSDLRVEDVMVPRADIIAIEDTASMRELMQKFTEASHSRIPIYHETLDDVQGMVHVKDFLRWLTQRGGRKKDKAKAASGGALSVPAAELALTVKASGLAREVLFVPPSMPAGDLLLKMQTSHIHLALVIDEYGGSDGLVSIEDLVEEIIGDIEDEHDIEAEKLVKKQDDNTYLADARVPIATLDKMLGVDLLPDEEEDEADTLGGLIFEMAGRVPPRGEIVRHASGLEFEILQSDPRRVKRIRIRLPRRDEPAADEQASDEGA